ncbi:hypothetical protein T265_05645 [Opisthorchis viverrini]|uniref:Uncharacterized protein n=1 Tax=Opisthorchis viverrini TaxID=6198 RepID=A0A074ZNB9_OPIVI|nr:hypothetical protein T265_05645 [Opisthorchis viverrini]KER27242.1 hypothetical protein T265_05645 [Opisthorchis viverrini]
MGHESICVLQFMVVRRPHLDRRTIRVLNQSLWLKSLTARQRCLAGNANALPFLRNKSPHVPIPNLEGQETVFVRPLTIDQPGMRDIAQWIAEVRKPSHHGKVQFVRRPRPSRGNAVPILEDEQHRQHPNSSRSLPHPSVKSYVHHHHHQQHQRSELMLRHRIAIISLKGLLRRSDSLLAYHIQSEVSTPPDTQIIWIQTDNMNAIDID